MNLRQVLAKMLKHILSGIYAADYSHDREKRAELEAHLNTIDAALSGDKLARLRLLDAEAKVIRRQP